MRILGDKGGPCKFCHSKGKPLCESHIVPEYCYEYEKRGNARRALGFHAPTANRGGKPQIIQKGYREYLLCEDCEQWFNRLYETPFLGFLRNKIMAKGAFAQGPVSFQGVDYHAVKLFILSIVWRSRVSEGFGKSLKLGPYAEKIRRILWNDQSVPQDQYPMYGNVILDNDGYPFFGFVCSPRVFRLRQAHVCNMALAGCEWNVVLSDHGVPKPYETWQHNITKSGDIHLVAMHYRHFNSVRELAQTIQQGGR